MVKYLFYITVENTGIKLNFGFACYIKGTVLTILFKVGKGGGQLKIGVYFKVCFFSLFRSLLLLLSIL